MSAAKKKELQRRLREEFNVNMTGSVQDLQERLIHEMTKEREAAPAPKPAAKKNGRGPKKKKKPAKKKSAKKPPPIKRGGDYVVSSTLRNNIAWPSTKPIRSCHVRRPCALSVPAANSPARSRRRITRRCWRRRRRGGAGTDRVDAIT